jgi:replicative DNA helicase
MPTQTVEFTGPEVLPHSVQAEQSVLGGLLLDNRAWDDIADLVSEGDFYRLDHRMIFGAIAQLVERGDPCDVVTLSEWLDSQGQLNDAGGLAYLGTIANDTPSAANVAAYASIVREHSIRRQLYAAGLDIQHSAMNGAGQCTDELVEAAHQRVTAIDERTAGHEPAPQKELLREAVDRLDERYNAGGALLGLDTGFTDLNEKTAGLQGGDLVILAGRPSMGKTALAVNIAAHVMPSVPVLVFSMEMPRAQITDRLIASTARVNFKVYRSGQLDDDELKRVTAATAKLAPCEHWVDDRSALTVTELCATARRHQRRYGLGLVIIDYLQLMKGTGENRTQEVANITGGLKALAKDLNVPVLALSQLNRSLESRPNKRPLMSDLRDSGAIEQDADQILFLYRDEVYNDASEHVGIAELNIAKNRNGERGRIYLTFLGQFVRFENFAGVLPALPKMKSRHSGGFDASKYQQ